ncbi:MAG: GNAT family N-acetyltransferase [Actinomycetota bacterium]
MTKRRVLDVYELDDDPARIDVPAVVDFLHTQTYWGSQRPPPVIERAITRAFRVVGLYVSDSQVGFARAVSDGEIIAYLADVYVHPDHRGKGLGIELVKEMIDNGPLHKLRWMLHTKDAHELYRKFGFAPPDDRYMERPLTGYAE